MEAMPSVTIVSRYHGIKLNSKMKSSVLLPATNFFESLIASVGLRLGLSLIISFVKYEL